jgi:hypothetical protein
MMSEADRLGAPWVPEQPMETNWDALWTFSQGTEKYLESQKGYLACVTRRVRNDSGLLRTEAELEISFIGGLATITGYGRVKKDIEESKKT